MLDGQVYRLPRTIDTILQDHKGRRTALVKALITELDEFFQQCDPDKGELCVFGHPNEEWEVTSPVQDIPPSIPDPISGINFFRNAMPLQIWLEFVACHSDSWLLAVSAFLAARAGFDKFKREKLFDSILDIPTVYEVVIGKAPAPRRKSISKAASKPRKKARRTMHQPKTMQLRGKEPMQVSGKEPMQADDEESSSSEEDDKTLCGACKRYGRPGDFWICCDECETWYHGVCVNVTPEMARSIRRFKCPLHI